MHAIRDELKLMRTELSSRLDMLERRQTGTEVRLATELTAVVGAIGDLKAVIVEDRKLRGAV